MKIDLKLFKTLALSGAGQIAGWLTALALLPEKLSSISSTCTVHLTKTPM